MVEQGVALCALPIAQETPVVLALKKGGTPRLCVDYKRLIEMSVRDTYPTPRWTNVLTAWGYQRLQYRRRKLRELQI